MRFNRFDVWLLISSHWPVAFPAHLDQLMLFSMGNQALGSVIQQKLS